MHLKILKTWPFWSRCGSHTSRCFKRHAKKTPATLAQSKPPGASPKIDRLARSRSRAPTVGPQSPVGAVGPRPADDGRAPTVGSGQSGPDRPTTVGPQLSGPGRRRWSGPDCQGPVGAVGPRPADNGRTPLSGPGRGSRAPTGRRQSGPDSTAAALTSKHHWLFSANCFSFYAGDG